MSNLADLQRIGYTIEACSSYTNMYCPENIIVDKPDDQSSRWSGVHHVNNGGFKQAEWILLKLDTLAIVRNITFGKFHKPHPCNLKEFRIFAGLAPQHMVEIIHTGLRNDTASETFTIGDNSRFSSINPCRYIKIVPIAAHGQGYNTTIWHVSLHGTLDSIQVHKLHSEFSHETLAMRTICSSLRRRNLPYQGLLAHTGVYLEHPTVTLLHDALVHQGNYDEAEAIMESIVHRDNLVDIYAYQPSLLMTWEPITAQPIADMGGMTAPCARGGHQMCLDYLHGNIYLFGGWDGQKDLCDFWSYSVKEKSWACISEDSTRDGGPCARSCHRMVFDPRSQSMFMLGMSPPAGSSGSPEATSISSDFWRYSVRPLGNSQWIKLSSNTKVDGGPGPIYDHGMAIDTRRGVLYVFGGKIIDLEALQHSDLVKYSGMYTFHLETNTWTNLSEHIEPPIHLRSGHSMFFDDSRDRLYILAGQYQQRHKSETKYFSDIWSFSLESKVYSEVVADTEAFGRPDPGLASRAILDSSENEIYFFSGILQSSRSNDLLQDRIWIYQMDKNRWMKVANQSPRTSSPMKEEPEGSGRLVHPRLRYAHQVVYDPRTKTFYMFGGTAVEDENLRLNDFWSSTLQRPSRPDILRRAKFQIRRQRFVELTLEGNQVEALTYLQNSVHEVVDHEDAEEDQTFRSLLKHLLLIPLETPTEETPLVQPSGSAHDSLIQQIELVDNGDGGSSNHSGIPSTPRHTYPGLGVEPRSSSPINLDSPEVGNSALPTSSPVISSRVGSVQGSDSPFPSPTPDFNQPIARAMGDSFPPPPSPAGDMDPEFPSNRPHPSRRLNSHEMDVHRGFRRIASPYRSSPPPPAPVMQYRSLPSAISRSVSHITDLASSSEGVDTYLGDSPGRSSIPDSLFKGRRRLFDELMKFVIPEGREPPQDVTELLGGPSPIDLDYTTLS